MFFVYVLQSATLGKRYVGSTADVIQRLGQHNAGFSKWTKSGRPWKLVHHEVFDTKGEAHQ
jgi:putative endonuclease